MKAKELRKRAWDALKGRYWWAVLAAVLAWIFGIVSFSTGSTASAGANDSSDVAVQFHQQISSMPKGAVAVLFFILLSVLIVCIFLAILSGSVKLGYSRFNMDLFTEVQKPSMHLLFSRTKIVWKALLLELVTALIICVGFILFIIPGIIFALSLSQVYYIMGENPDLGVMETIKKSREIMQGNKWSKFCLDLSFIGWALLASIVPGGYVLLAPYTQAADAAFYLDRTGRLKEGAADLGELEAKA